MSILVEDPASDAIGIWDKNEADVLAASKSKERIVRAILSAVE